MSLHTMQQMNADLVILTETHLTGVHTRATEGYQVQATVAVNHSQGGVAIFWCDGADTWQVESEHAHGPNVMSFELVTGRQ